MTYLAITLQIAPKDRAAAAAVYERYKQPFLNQAPGAKSKELLLRDEDVQVLHSLASKGNAMAYLQSELFNHEVVAALKPLLLAAPDIRIYES